MARDEMTLVDEAREQARDKRAAARRAHEEVQQQADRAVNIIRWGGTDRLEELRAREQAIGLERAELEARAAMEAADAEFLRVSADSAEARAPHHREHHQRLTSEIHALLVRLVQIHDAGEATGDAARRECCVDGTWADPQAFDRSILEIAGMAKLQLPAWEARMRLSGWLTS